MAQKVKPNVVPFRRVLDAEPELTVGLPPTAAPAQAVTERPATDVDLSDKPKVRRLIGPGRVGKTMLVRFAAEMVANRGGQAYAAADPQNRSLVQYLDDVAQPATNDAAATTRWLEHLIRHAMSEAISVVCDLGGGDPACGYAGLGSGHGGRLAQFGRRQPGLALARYACVALPPGQAAARATLPARYVEGSRQAHLLRRLILATSYDLIN